VHFNAPLCFLTNVYFGFVLLFLFTFNAHKEKKKYQEKEKSAWVAELFEFIMATPLFAKQTNTSFWLACA